MSAHASGASNGSTSSSPFFATQNSSFFGTAVGNSNGASGASNGSTSSSPFFATRNSNFLGTAVGNSNGASGALCGCTSASPFFATQNTNSFVSTAAGNSNGASGAWNRPTFGSVQVPTQNSNLFGTAVGASNGSTSASPFFANQTPNPFGTAVGNSNGGSGASNVSTFASPFPAAQSSNGAFGAWNAYTPAFAVVPNQSSKPFGSGAVQHPTGTNTSPFVQSSLSFPEFGGAAKTSRFGQTPLNFGGFGEELSWEDYKQKRNEVSSTNPFQPANSCVWFPPSEPLAFTFKRSSENPFHGTGGGPAIADNSCGGTRAPYQPTPAEENVPLVQSQNLSWINGRPVLTSISAMNCYCNKSHEELRSEDYNQIRNGGHSSAANVSGVSNPLPNPSAVSFTKPFQPANSSGWFPPCESPPFTFNRSSENPIHRTDSSSSLGSDKNRTTPVQTSPVQTSVAQTHPSPTPTTTTTMSNQISNVNLNDPTLSITASGGVSFIPSFVNCIIPGFGASGSSGVLNSVIGTPVLGFPVLIQPTLAFIPQYPQVSDPTSALRLHQPARMILLNPTSSASTTNPANSHLSTIAETTSHVSPSAGVLEEQITNLSISAATPAPTNAVPSGSASPSDFNLPVTQHSSSIPKGLEIIIEHLGFNPWEGKNHIQDSQSGQILLCEDASDDADILSLAEFAVEQHNAMEQFRDQPDGKVELLKVTAACLEAVDGGKYHIVLEAKKAASSGIRVYAVVLLKKTNRPTPLIVLQRWLHCLPSYSSDCSKEMVPFRARLI